MKVETVCVAVWRSTETNWGTNKRRSREIERQGRPRLIEFLASCHKAFSIFVHPSRGMSFKVSSIKLCPQDVIAAVLFEPIYFKWQSVEYRKELLKVSLCCPPTFEFNCVTVGVPWLVQDIKDSSHLLKWWFLLNIVKVEDLNNIVVWFIGWP